MFERAYRKYSHGGIFKSRDAGNSVFSNLLRHLYTLFCSVLNKFCSVSTSYICNQKLITTCVLITVPSSAVTRLYTPLTGAEHMVHMAFIFLQAWQCLGPAIMIFIVTDRHLVRGIRQFGCGILELAAVSLNWQGTAAGYSHLHFQLTVAI